MDKNKLIELIYILISIFFSILVIKIFIWLLPIILIAILAYFIYKKIKALQVSEKWEKDNKKTKPKKNRKIIIDEEKY